jgi:hypothetical protein
MNETQPMNGDDHGHEALDTPAVILRHIDELERRTHFDPEAFELMGRLLKAGRDLAQHAGWPSPEASRAAGVRVIALLTRVAQQPGGLGLSILALRDPPRVPPAADSYDALLTLLGELEQLERFDLDCFNRMNLIVAASGRVWDRGGFPGQEASDDFGRRVLALMDRMGYKK